MSIFNQKPAFYTLIRMIACNLIILCGAFLCIQTESYAKTDTNIVISDDPAEFALPENVIDPLHGEKVVIDTETDLVELESGEKSDIREVFDIPKKDAENLTLENGSVNKERISDYLDEKDIYVISDEGKDQLGVTFPFACKRILLFIKEGNLTESYGAYRVAYNTLSELYTLDYKTEEEAKAAFDHLVSDYGRDHVMVDLPVHCQGNTSAEAEQFSETDALSVSWGNDIMHLDAVRDEANADENLTGQVTVAVLDTGINPDHELFAGRLNSNGASFIKGSSAINDDNGHGSHVAGIIADGTSDNVKILSLKILDQKGQGGLGELIQAVDYAVSQNAGVINMSMGMSLQGNDQYWTYLDYQAIEASMKAANESGCICLAAAGNDGKNMDPGALAMYPAISQYTFAVSSINSGKTRADTSNYGNCVDFTAPGIKIKSASASGNSNYCLMSGTSMAVPHLSAACAMLKLYNQNASVPQIKNLLLSLTEDLGEQGKDQYYGEGLIVFPVSQTQQDEPTAYDHARANNVIDLIGNLPTNVSSDDEQTITIARNAYNALTKKQKTLIDAKTLAKLTDAEGKLKKAKEADQTAVGSVIARINALPAQITTADEAAVNAARAAYEALTFTQKAMVSEAVKSKLTTSEKNLATAKKATQAEAAKKAAQNPARALSVLNTPLVLKAKASKVVTVSITPANASKALTDTVVIKSANRKVITVSSIKLSGTKLTFKIKGIKAGKSTVYVKVGAKTAKVSVTVLKKANKTLKVKAAKKATIKLNKTAKIAVQVTAIDKKSATTDTILAKSGKPAVADITNISTVKGKVLVKVKGLKKGKSRLTVKVGGKRVKINLTVK